jgi:hypothetical protein
MARWSTHQSIVQSYANQLIGERLTHQCIDAARFAEQGFDAPGIRWTERYAKQTA